MFTWVERVKAFSVIVRKLKTNFITCTSNLFSFFLFNYRAIDSDRQYIAFSTQKKLDSSQIYREYWIIKWTNLQQIQNILRLDNNKQSHQIIWGQQDQIPAACFNLIKKIHKYTTEMDQIYTDTSGNYCTITILVYFFLLKHIKVANMCLIWG